MVGPLLNQELLNFKTVEEKDDCGGKNGGGNSYRGGEDQTQLCFICGEPGHNSYELPTIRKEPNVKTYNAK